MPVDVDVIPIAPDGFKYVCTRSAPANEEEKAHKEMLILKTKPGNKDWFCKYCTVGFAEGTFTITASMNYEEEGECGGGSKAGAKVHLRGTPADASLLFDQVGPAGKALRTCLLLVREVVVPGGAYHQAAKRCFPRTMGWSAACSESFPPTYKDALRRVFIEK